MQIVPQTRAQGEPLSEFWTPISMQIFLPDCHVPDATCFSGPKLWSLPSQLRGSTVSAWIPDLYHTDRKLYLGRKPDQRHGSYKSLTLSVVQLLKTSASYFAQFYHCGKRINPIIVTSSRSIEALVHIMLTILFSLIF